MWLEPAQLLLLLLATFFTGCALTWILFLIYTQSSANVPEVKKRRKRREYDKYDPGFYSDAWSKRNDNDDN